MRNCTTSRDHKQNCLKAVIMIFHFNEKEIWRYCYARRISFPNALPVLVKDRIHPETIGEDNVSFSALSAYSYKIQSGSAKVATAEPKYHT